MDPVSSSPPKLRSCAHAIHLIAFPAAAMRQHSIAATVSSAWSQELNAWQGHSLHTSNRMLLRVPSILSACWASLSVNMLSHQHLLQVLDLTAA